MESNWQISIQTDRAVNVLSIKRKTMNLEDLLRKDPVTVDPSPGQLLVAGPMIGDLNFSRTAVLILERTPEQGHFGLVLNRATDANLAMLVENWNNADKIPLYLGGPVELDRMFMLHRLGNIIAGSTELCPGIYTGGDTDEIKEYIESGEPTEGKIRFFMGYSGWGEGQLAAEIIEHTWAVNVSPDLNELLSGNGQEYWRKQVMALGQEYKSWLNIPGHPQLN